MTDQGPMTRPPLEPAPPATPGRSAFYILGWVFFVLSIAVWPLMNPDTAFQETTVAVGSSGFGVSAVICWATASILDHLRGRR